MTTFTQEAIHAGQSSAGHMAQLAVDRMPAFDRVWACARLFAGRDAKLDRS